jgi:GPH family glycoside/pentoside/hexuronide:cation symporter
MLSNSRLAIFSAPAFSLTALGLPLIVILPPLYAELGLSLTVVGAVFMTARFFDVFTDPLFGVMGDKARTRWGRRKPAIVVGIPVLLLGSYRVFIPGEIVSETDLLVSLLTLYLGWTLLTLAHTAWASEISSDYDQRSRIMSALQFSGLLGAVVVLAVPAVVDALYPEADMRMRSKIMG